MSDRPLLLAVSPLQVWRINDGLSLRCNALLRGLGERWRVILMSPGQPESGECAPELHAHVPLPSRPMRSVPDPTWQKELIGQARSALDEYACESALLWPGTEFLRWRVPNFPPCVSDRVDSLTLQAARDRLGASGGLRRWLTNLVEIARYEHNLAWLSDWSVTVGEDDGRTLRLLGPTRRISVLPNGVEVRRMETLEPTREPSIIFSGVLGYPPNVDAIRFAVREIWPRVRQQLPDARFLLAGRSPVAEVKALAETPGVELHANVPDLAGMIAHSWLSVAPMLTGSGIKNKILEAWAVGTPTVMTPMAANGLHPSPELSTCVAKEGSDLADLIIELLRNEKRRDELSTHFFELAERHHSWGVTVDAVDRKLLEIRRPIP